MLLSKSLNGDIIKNDAEIFNKFSDYSERDKWISTD